MTASKSSPQARIERMSRKDQDLPLKLRVASSLVTSGYYVRINVGLSATSSRGLADVTDIDVIGIRHDVTFKQDAIAVTCKSGESKALSPAREIFYLRGVLDYVNALNGVAVFSRKPIPAHIRDLGRRLNILALSGIEIDDWCNSLTKDMPEHGFFKESDYDEYLKGWARISDGNLVDYFRADYWFYYDFRNLQNIIGLLKRNAPRLTVQHKWVSLILLDAAVHLCLTVFDLCRQVRLLGLSSIADTTTAYLFGGAPSFKARKDLYTKVQHLLASTGVLSPSGPSLPPLEPIYTEALSELAIRLIERPHAAILIPLVLQDNFWRVLGAKGVCWTETKNSLAAEKLAQDLLEFIKKASGLQWVPKL